LHEKTFNKRKVTAAEGALEKHTHYFANEATIYDVCDFQHKGRRLQWFLRHPIHIGQLKKIEKPIIDAIPRAMLTRFETWKHSFESDFLQLLQSSPEAFQDAIEYEKEFLKNKLPIKKSFVSTISSFLRSFYHSLIESSCK
jgi:hypothetical protein